MVTLEDYQGEETAWCPGCGNFGILEAVKKALVALELEPSQLLLVTGIGQAAKLPHYTKCHTFNGLHGRTLPVATAAKIVNKDLVVVAESGDGDMYGEGGNHFMHAIRRNVNITMVVHNNMVYGLTKGQASPTSQEGFMTKVQPKGVLLKPLNPLALAVALGAGFVARGFSGKIDQLVEIIVQAIEYQGFALVDVLQPCVSFNRVNTFKWFNDRVYELGDDFPTDNLEAAFAKAQEFEEKIPLGIIYRKERMTYEDHLPFLAGPALIHRERKPEKVAALFDSFK